MGCGQGPPKEAVQVAQQWPWRTSGTRWTPTPEVDPTRRALTGQLLAPASSSRAGYCGFRQSAKNAGLNGTAAPAGWLPKTRVVLPQ